MGVGGVGVPALGAVTVVLIQGGFRAVRGATSGGSRHLNSLKIFSRPILLMHNFLKFQTLNKAGFANILLTYISLYIIGAHACTDWLKSVDVEICGRG